MKTASRAVLLIVLTLCLGMLANAALAQQSATGEAGAWQQLFNGKDFSGWQNAGGKAPNPGWVVEDGAMARTKGAGDIWTKDRFGNFALELEFTTEGNSGIFIRTDNPRDCVQTGLEIQVLQPVAKPGKHSCGALYDAVAPAK